MDPFSIITGSVGLAGAIAKVSVITVEFSRDARDATSDLDALSAELKSLSTILNPLPRSISGPAAAAAVPATLVAQVNTTLVFDVLIVKVPIVGLHGVQFRRVSGNWWAYYDTLKEQIIRELRI